MNYKSGQGIGIFGEVLFDQFPDGEQVLGGAPFNVAWHLQAFGAQPRFISKVGDDAQGERIRQTMRAWGMPTDQLQCDEHHPTGAVAVSFNEGEPSYAILDQQAYDFIEWNAATTDYSVLYHGSLALRNSVSRQTWENLLAQHNGIVFVDVNLRSPWWNPALIQQSLRQANWAKLNEEELRLLGTPKLDLPTAMQQLLADYQLDTLVVTCGSQGAWALTAAGECQHIAPAANLLVVDTVGAGDAFAAVLLLGIQRQWLLPLTLQRAQDFASALVGKRGATVQDADFYQPFIDAWQLA
ncbi:carbohydrate kinase [Methylosoma difficile]